MEVNRRKTSSDFGLTCTKYLLFLLNVVFVISSVVTISGGVSTIFALTSYYYLSVSGFQMLSIFWLVVGIIFMTVALFGIFVAFKESTFLANLYGMAMMLVFTLQISAAIAGFTLMSKSRYMVTNQLHYMMNDYQYYYRLEVDWIQSKFKCCGIDGPNDWENFDRFSTPSPYNQWYERTTYDPDYPTTEEPRKNLMPASCCVPYTNYVNLTCEKSYTSGCFEPIHQIVSESIMMVGSSALVFSVVQMLGIVLGFMYARIVRRKKTERDVQIWNSGQQYSSERGTGYQPTHIDYSQIVN